MSEKDQQTYSLEETIGYRFGDRTLLERAMTHSSSTAASHCSYERLEFLGDAVLGLVVAQALFEWPEHYDEGEMSELKSEVVNRRSLAKAGHRLGLDAHLRVGKGLSLKRRCPPSLVADAYEALVGAVFLDGGLAEARAIVLGTIKPELKAALQRRHPANFKSILQRLVQADGGQPPDYETVAEAGPEHARRFHVVVRVGGEQAGSGWGKTKKLAEQAAAEEGISKLYAGSGKHARSCGPDPNADRPGACSPG
jgi:ribonuclease-3